MTTILIRPEDLTRNTIIGGNVDVDRYLASIKACQMTLIKPLLGSDLYNKICLDFENSNLTGVYLELYDDYVKELTIHGAAEIYIANGAYIVSNSGITKTKTDSSETISKEEVDYLVQASRKLYELYKEEFFKWIKDQDIPEYIKPYTTGYNKTIGGWYLRKNKDC
jgi:hypothetical protein